eukprot:432060_1
MMTIKITLNDCACDDGECVITKDKINQILIAQLDDVDILSTDILDNKIIMASVDLDKDMITAGLEAEYGDVDVTVEDTEENGEQKDQNENDLLLIVVHVERGHGCSCCEWVIKEEEQ